MIGGLKFVLVAVLLAGCASKPIDMKLKPGEAIPTGETLVIGGVSLSSDSGRSYVDVIDLNTSRIVFNSTLEKRVEKIYWHLPPGSYAVMNFGSSSAWTKTTSIIRVFAMFTVDTDDKVQYIGNIYINRTNSTSMIKDEYQEAVAAFISDFPSISHIPKKKLSVIGATR